MTTRNKVLLGILGAAAAGVVIGLLIAPDKGKDTRKKIRKAAGEWADSVTNFWAKSKQTLDDLAEEAKGKMKHGKSAAEEKMNKVKENYS